MPYITQDDLDNWFSYHAPTLEQQDKYIAVRQSARQFADLIISVCPECADTTVAIQKLRELAMQVNLSIACNT